MSSNRPAAGLITPQVDAQLRHRALEPVGPAGGQPTGEIQSCGPVSLCLHPFPWLAAALGGENPQPIFRDPNPNLPVATHESLPAALAATLGKGCGRRILPYRLQDRYGRERSLREFRAIVREESEDSFDGKP